MGSTPFCEAIPTRLSRKVVENLGEQVAGKLGYIPGEDLEPIVRGLGGILEMQPWDEATDGGSLEVVPEEKQFRIRISPFAGKLRNRFTIAHELGHYFLHAEVGKKAICIQREGTGRLEWEANWFAAGFLIPAEKFKADWEESGGNIGKLIGIYQVSEPVIEIRRESLGLK